MIDDQSEVIELIDALNLLVGVVSPPVNTPQNPFQIVVGFHSSTYKSNTGEASIIKLPLVLCS